MTHWPYIAVSYGLAALVIIGFGAAAWLRASAAQKRLAAIDPRASRNRS